MRLAISKKNSGFGLIEMLVYIAVFVIVSVGSIVLVFSLQDQVTEHRANQELTRSSIGIFERMALDIRRAESITTGASTFGSNPGALTLVEGATTTVYAVSSGELTVSVNSGAAVPLTSNRTSVTNFVLTHFDNTTSEAVRVNLTLQANFGSIVVDESFSNTSVLLSSYE